jgi:endonuclease-3
LAVLRPTPGKASNIPDEYRVPAHHLMILHGRYTCKARSPLCPECILLDLCEYEEKNL